MLNNGYYKVCWTMSTIQYVEQWVLYSMSNCVVLCTVCLKCATDKPRKTLMWSILYMYANKSMLIYCRQYESNNQRIRVTIAVCNIICLIFVIEASNPFNLVNYRKRISLSHSRKHYAAYIVPKILMNIWIEMLVFN